MTSIQEDGARKIIKRAGKQYLCESCGKEILEGSEAMSYRIPFKGPRGSPLKKYQHVDCWSKRQEQSKRDAKEHAEWMFYNG